MSYLGRSAKLSLKAQEKVSFLATAGQTSKTGLSYVPNFVEVYVNGILLTDTTDFTATNGNSVTFTVALALNDEVTVVSLKTFTVADHYTKTEDDSLLAAKLPLAGGTMTGDVTFADGVYAKFGTGNDLRIRHDGSNSYIAEMGTGDLIVQTNGANFLVENTDGDNMVNAVSDGTVELYHNAVKKLETTATGVAVTGGIALGGTAAANTLDDYEEGTWTPVIVGGSLSRSIEAATYTKIGNIVQLQAYLTLADNGNATALSISGMPFTNIGSNGYSVGLATHAGGSDLTSTKFARADSNSATLVFYKNASGTVTQAMVDASFFIFSITYRTA